MLAGGVGRCARAAGPSALVQDWTGDPTSLIIRRFIKLLAYHEVAGAHGSAAAARASRHPRLQHEGFVMKVLFDLFPIILFFAAYKVADIYVATAVAIAATFAQIAWVKLRHGKVEKMLWISLAIIVVFGGATLLLHDPTFIKWKPTVLYWAFAVVLLGSDLVLKKNLIRAMMSEQLTLPDPVWTRLNLSWAGFFTVMGVVNLYVAFNYSENAWVNFKLFGGIGLMIVFVVIQGLMLSRFVENEERK
jgi:intracellular septation protein